jgi:hypothetical protein
MLKGDEFVLEGGGLCIAKCGNALFDAGDGKFPQLSVGCT